MKRFIGFLILMLCVQLAGVTQSVIADQQCTIGGEPLRLKTFERSANGYLNTLSLDGVASEGEDVNGYSFWLEKLDANDFYVRYWKVVDTLLGATEHTQADYAQAAELFGGIVLALNTGESRPVAGRLLLRERVLGWDPDNVEGFHEHTRYFIKPSKYSDYVKTRDKALSKFQFDIKNLTTTEEQINVLENDRAERQKLLQSFVATLALASDSLKRLNERIDEFLKNNAAKAIQDTVKAHALAQHYQAMLTQLTTPPSTKADTVLMDSLERVGINFQRLDSMRLAQQEIVHVNALILRESGLNFMGKGNMTRKAALEKRVSSLQRLISTLEESIDAGGKHIEEMEAYKQSASDELGYYYFLLEIDSVRIEFNQGMIERIVATTRHIPIVGNPEGGETMIFTNVYPIGFSTFRNFKKTINSNFLVDSDDTHMIPLGDLIDYIPYLRLNTRDFSPADTAMTFFPSEKEYVLHKDESADILKAKVFTDFVGLDDSEPNGLIQTEIEKRINLFTWRLPVGRGNFLNTSTFQYIKPIVTLSKIDAKLRQAPISVLPRAVGSQFELRPHMRTIDLLRYESLSTGIDLNLWLLDSQPWKGTFFLNFGARFGRVGLIDSLRTVDSLGVQTTGVTDVFAVNTIRFYPEAQFMFYPDERFNFGFAYRPTYLRLLSDRLAQVPNSDALLGGNAEQNFGQSIIHTLELSATLRLSERGELYGRYRMHLQNKYRDTNFYQAQVGYSMQITKKVSAK